MASQKKGTKRVKATQPPSKEEENSCKKTKHNSSDNDQNVPIDQHDEKEKPRLLISNESIITRNVDQTNGDDDDDDILNYNVDGFGTKSTYKLKVDENGECVWDYKEELKDLINQKEEAKRTKEEIRINRELDQQIEESNNTTHSVATETEDEPSIRSFEDLELEQFKKNFNNEYERFQMCDLTDMSRICQIVDEIENKLDEIFLIEDEFDAKFCFETLKSMTRYCNTENSFLLSNSAASETDNMLNKWRKYTEILFNIGFKKLVNSSQQIDKNLLMFVAKFVLSNFLFSNFERGLNIKHSTDPWMNNEDRKGFYFEENDDEENEEDSLQSTNSISHTKPNSIYSGLTQKNYYQIDIGKVSFIFSLLDKEQKNELVLGFMKDYGFDEKVHQSYTQNISQAITQFYPLYFFKSISNMCYGFDSNIYLVISKILLLIVRNSIELDSFTTERILEIEIVDGQYSEKDKVYLDQMLESILEKLKGIVRKDLYSFYFFFLVTSTFHVTIKSNDTFKKCLFEYQSNIGIFRSKMNALTIFNHSTTEESKDFQ